MSRVWMGLILAMTSGLPVVAATPAWASGDATAGHVKARQCAPCHGIDGISKLPEAPNLAGQNPMYLAKTLADFKSGARQNEIMNVIAPALSDADVADLVAYFSSLEITVKAPAR